MSLADDLQATADRLRDGWTIDSLARAKRAQENTMARTTHDTIPPPNRRQEVPVLATATIHTDGVCCEIILPPPGACYGDGLAQHALMERARLVEARAETLAAVEDLILRHTGRVEPELADRIVDVVLADAVLVQR